MCVIFVLFRYGIAYLVNSSWLVVFFRFGADLYITDNVLKLFYFMFPSFHQNVNESSSETEIVVGANKMNTDGLVSKHEQGEHFHIQSVIPAQVDKQTAKRLSGHLFDEASFDLNADKESCTISREQFVAKCHEKPVPGF